MNPRTAIIIPARFNSSRFPGKPLTKLCGKPMILWVAEKAASAVGRDNVYVATENCLIGDVAKRGGFNTILTSSEALTGTDRVAEAAQEIKADIYINLQGDEPLVNVDDIQLVINEKKRHPECVINAYTWISEAEDAHSINIPKVVTNEKNELVYMSRSVLPGHKDKGMAVNKLKKQVCIYAFSSQELQLFLDFKRKSFLEQTEDIEILRFLELNKTVIMVEASPGSLAVDVPEDVCVVEQYLNPSH